ncbi:MAG TPA: alpha/beta fold hydrolase [Anaerovoracaceae bacterium]|nr:alpha/beta fold hydrolase [Anaerovoracaceae bacterium]
MNSIKTENKGILLIHGFAGDPGEVAPLREHLIQRGYYVKSPLLPGHGLTKSDLSKTTHKEWITAAEQAYFDLSGKCGRIVVIGFSMGGLIAVNLCKYSFSGLVTVNMPIYYWNPGIIAANLITDFRHYGKKYLIASTDKSFFSMVEFQRLLTKTKPLLGNIACKTMVVQALDDDTVHHRSADFILKKVRTAETVFKLSRGGHQIFHSESGEEVCQAVESFVRTC